RLVSDWSSDVCSSDLIVVGGTVLTGRHGASGEIGYNLRSVEDVGLDLTRRTILEQTVSGGAFLRAGLALVPRARSAAEVFAATEIGRASCRGRGGGGG